MAFLACLLLGIVSGWMLQGILAEVHENNGGPRTPSNVRIRVDEESVEIHWSPPSDISSASFCIIQYTESPFWSSETPTSSITIAIPVRKDQTMQTITGLDRDTRYKVRLYCLYGNTNGPSTDWIHVTTRTVSGSQRICSGRIPNAFLEPKCVDNERSYLCEYTCDDGYRISEVPAVIAPRTPWLNGIYIYCMNGTWKTNFEEYGHTIDDICLPEAAFQKCPSTIPNGRLEQYCGPATDWLCDFSCNNGYHKHPFMYGTLKGFSNAPEKLFCDEGTWKTGYENKGLDVSNLCFGGNQTCTGDIPNGSVYTPCLSGYSCGMSCNTGYRLKELADTHINCKNGEWLVGAAKHDATITAQTVCIPNDVERSCSHTVPNGRIPEGCTVDCEPECNDGYYVIGEHGLSMGPESVSCENGQWLTKSQPYTGDNICFPDGGMQCVPQIPNGYVPGRPGRLTDYGRNREYHHYDCDQGFRFHRGVRFIECVAGHLTTWNERFGIWVDDLCIPISER